jgi:hypothetical protein
MSKGWSRWSITRKLQFIFTLAGTAAPLALMVLSILPATGPDWEGACWPVGLLGILLLAPGNALCKAWDIGEPDSLMAIATNGAIFFLIGTLLGWLESAKRERHGSRIQR